MQLNRFKQEHRLTAARIAILFDLNLNTVEQRLKRGNWFVYQLRNGDYLMTSSNDVAKQGGLSC